LKADLVICHYCKKEIIKRDCNIIEAIKNGYNLYCNRGCSYSGRRKRPIIIRNKKIGRSNVLNDKQIKDLRNKKDHHSVNELMYIFGIGRTTIYNYLKCRK